MKIKSKLSYVVITICLISFLQVVNIKASPKITDGHVYGTLTYTTGTKLTGVRAALILNSYEVDIDITGANGFYELYSGYELLSPVNVALDLKNVIDIPFNPIPHTTIPFTIYPGFDTNMDVQFNGWYSVEAASIEYVLNGN